MTREEAIRFLNEQREFLLKGCFWEETRMNINEAFDMAIEAIKAQEWIPVNERFPDVGKWVLVTISNHIDVARKIDIDIKGMSFDWENTCGRYVDQKVKAWMPLPEPFEEDDE